MNEQRRSFWESLESEPDGETFEGLKTFHSHEPKRSAVLTTDWQEHLPAVFEDLLETWDRTTAELNTLSSFDAKLNQLGRRVSRTEQSSCVSVPIQTLAPDPYILRREINVVMEQIGDEYLAHFYDANLSSCGDSRGEALYLLKDLIVGTFEMLKAHREEDLGVGPLRQLSVLREFLEFSNG